MKYLILSDIHIGNPLFKDIYRLKELLIDKNFDCLILNGDIFDVWEKSFEKITRDYSCFISLLNRLSTERSVIYVMGNHDHSKEELSTIFPYIKFVNEYKVNNTIFIHGHEYDNFIKDFSYVAKVLFYVQWIFERIGLNIQAHCREVMHSVSMKRQKKYYNDLVSKIEQQSVKDYNDKGFKNIVLGHTHMPKLIVSSDFKYINSGDWIHSKTYAIMEDNKFVLYNIDGSEYTC